jgi:hypothetical protein
MTHPIYKHLDEVFTRTKPNRSGERVVRPNTYITKSYNGTITVRLYATDIVRVSEVGVITLRHGGYLTNTTKDRIDWATNSKIKAFSKNKVFFIGGEPLFAPVEFLDGLNIDLNTGVVA